MLTESSWIATDNTLSNNYTETSMELNISQTVQATNETFPNIQIYTSRNISIILVYIILFLIAAIGNLTVFISLFRSRHRKLRISLMIQHLTVADLIVTFIMIPIEVGWRLTGRWMAGNIACKIIQFMRALGPYLSSNVLVCISLDRYFAVMYPLRVTVARKRGKYMVLAAWVASLIYCIPQCFVFHLKSHPQIPDFKQCVTFGSFPNEFMELVYNLSCILFLYFIPLSVIIIAYSCILAEISRTSKSHYNNNKNVHQSNGKMQLRRSDTKNIERARSRTLRMTVTIVVIYIFCCTPYTIMTLWYMLDRTTAEKILPAFVQDLFFMMVVSNSCMNPLVYGSFVIDFKKISCYCTDCGEKNSTDSLLHLKTVPVLRRSPNMQTSQFDVVGKNLKHVKCVEYQDRSTSNRPRVEKCYSETQESSTSSHKEMSFCSEPLILLNSNHTDLRRENCERRELQCLGSGTASVIRTGTSCVYYVNNEKVNRIKII